MNFQKLNCILNLVKFIFNKCLNIKIDFYIKYIFTVITLLQYFHIMFLICGIEKGNIVQRLTNTFH